MSIRFGDFGTTLDVFAGSIKILTLVIKNPATGLPENITNSTTFATVIWQCLKPDGTIIFQGEGEFNRPDSEVSYLTTAEDVATANVGNWIGKIILKNIDEQIIDQQTFNLNILE